MERVKPLQVRIEDFRQNLGKVVETSELPPFLLEMIIGEYLSGISAVAKREFAAARADWESGEAEKDGEKDG